MVILKEEELLEVSLVWLEPVDPESSPTWKAFGGIKLLT